MVTKYNIICKGHRLYKSLSELEYFGLMDDLIIQYYQTGSPKPAEVKTETYEDYMEVDYGS